MWVQNTGYLDLQATKEEDRARASLQADSLQRKIDEIVAGEEAYLEEVAHAGELLVAFVEKLKGAHAKADQLRQVVTAIPGVASSSGHLDLPLRISSRMD